MENICSEPILILRQNNKKFKQKQKLLNKRIKSKNFLRNQIESNHKIFQSNIDFYRNMTAQNLIWDKNYKFKCIINKIKQENSGLKARIWNIEKENRKMQRQIESWSLNEQSCINLKEKPYIDMSTFEKVIKDQDYNIVSMKIQICQLQKVYHDKEQLLEATHKQQKHLDKLLSLFNHQIASKKIQMYQLIEQQQNQNTHDDPHYQQMIKEKLSNSIVNQNQKLDLIQKNMQIKRKSKLNIENDLVLLRSECQLVKNVTFQEIQRLNDEIRLMRTQQIGGINSQKEKLKKIKRQILQLQCHMQAQSDKYIKQKIQISRQIDNLSQAISLLPGSQPNSSHKTISVKKQPKQRFIEKKIKKQINKNNFSEKK